MIPICKFSLRNIIEGFADFKDRKIDKHNFVLKPNDERIVCKTKHETNDPLFDNGIRFESDSFNIIIGQCKYIPRDSNDNPLYLIAMKLYADDQGPNFSEIMHAIRSNIPRHSLLTNSWFSKVYQNHNMLVKHITIDYLQGYIDYYNKSDDLSLIVLLGYQRSPDIYLQRLIKLKCKKLHIYLYEDSDSYGIGLKDWLYCIENLAFRTSLTIKLTVIIISPIITYHKTPNINDLLAYKNLDTFQLYNKHKLLYRYNRPELLDLRRIITRFQKTEAPNHPLTDKNIQSVIKSFLIG